MATDELSADDYHGPDTPVWKLMTRAIARISPEARVDEAAHKLSAVGAGALGVGSTEALTGVVSERDVTRALGSQADITTMAVGEIASDTVIWCDGQATAAAAARLMVDRGIRHLIVGDAEANRAEGIVSARDLLEALVGP